MTKKNVTSTKNEQIKYEIKSLIWIILLALAFRTFVAELFFVPTGSMKPTIVEGDYILSTKYSYGYSIYSIPFSPDLFKGRILKSNPERGDVIIMRPPHMEDRYIKRLIGLPGEKIEIIDDLIYINDKPIKRVEIGTYIGQDNVEYIKFRETLPNNVSYFTYKEKNTSTLSTIDRSNYGPKIIEEGKYFFLGDNRDNSGDSRYQLHTVEFRNLIAKARVIIFSARKVLWDAPLEFVDWVLSIRWNRMFSTLYSKN